MKLVIGGAYQGKLDYVMETEAIDATDVFVCEPSTLELDFSQHVIHNLQNLIWAQQQQGINSLAYLQAHRAQLQNITIICEDLSSGVVPIDAATRLWRETTGRCGVWLARESDEVIRVFCGIGTRIKP
jgi:adenosyl cobinamide kinase/adenosyl cobinamide phosphate guanylyltransferase